MLNEESAKLPDEIKITLYVIEEVYFATKWATQVIDLDFIKLKRSGSYVWYHNTRFDTRMRFVRFFFKLKKSLKPYKCPYQWK